MSVELLIDNSAWARLSNADLSDDRRNQIADQFESGRVAICLPFLLEAGYSARDAGMHARLLDELLSLPAVEIDSKVEWRTVDAQSQLAQVGHHRLPPVDLLMAALAERHDLAVLHYDSDYDLIKDKTDLRFDSYWLSKRGTLR